MAAVAADFAEPLLASRRVAPIGLSRRAGAYPNRKN